MEDLRILEDRLTSAEAAARDFACALREIAHDRSVEGGESNAFLAQNALELHPEFHEGTSE